MRRVCEIAAVILALLSFASPLHAQTPSVDSAHTITLAVPIAAGGGMDTIARAIAEKLSERLKQPVAVLQLLLERAGAPVSKDALMDAGWPGVTVEDGNLTVQIAALRRLFAERAGGEDWIETLPRRGYCGQPVGESSHISCRP